MKKLSLKNKLLYVSFYLTVLYVLVFSVISNFFNFDKHPDAAIGIGFILLFVVNIMFVIFMHNLVIKDIDILKNKLQRVGKGSMNVSFTTKRKDEMGDIFLEVDKIMKNNIEMLEKVKKNSNRIDESSKNVKLLIIENKDILGQLSKNIDIVKDGTNNQIKGIAEIEISVEEMVMGINRINTTTVEVSNNAGKSVEEAIRGNSALERVVIQMDDIRKNSEKSMTTIRVLGDQIKEIQKIVDVIRSISSRTNLLALNATIEAERAGENGEGFIVVAEEIKDLAVKSTESTVQIEKIARNIMERKDKAIEIIEKSAKEIRNGISVVSEASQAFHKILVSTDDIGNQLNELSSSSEQLSSNTYQIVQSIEKTSTISKDFSQNTLKLETFVDQQGSTVEKLLNSIESLDNTNEEIGEFLEKINR